MTTNIRTVAFLEEHIPIRQTVCVYTRVQGVRKHSWMRLWTHGEYVGEYMKLVVEVSSKTQTVVQVRGALVICPFQGDCVQKSERYVHPLNIYLVGDDEFLLQ